MNIEEEQLFLTKTPLKKLLNTVHQKLSVISSVKRRSARSEFAALIRPAAAKNKLCIKASTNDKKRTEKASSFVKLCAIKEKYGFTFKTNSI